MRPEELRALPKDELIRRAETLGVPRPRVLTQVELVDEIVQRTTVGERRDRARGWLGKARDLLARVVERGLHLPDAAARFASAPRPPMPRTPPPLPTVTLAEIYAAQGHLPRAIKVLDQVLEREPGHAEALGLRARLAATLSREVASAAVPAAPGADATPVPASTPADPPADAPVDAGGASPDEPSMKPTDSPPTPAAPATPAPATTSPAAEAPPEARVATPARATDGPATPAMGDDAAGPPTEPSGGRVAPPPGVAARLGVVELAADGPVAEAELAPPPRPSSAQLEEIEASEAELNAEAARLEADAAAETTDDVALAVGDAELPGGYGVDEIVALAVDPTTAYVYWEVRPARFARARWSDPTGKLVVRVLTAEVEGGHGVLRSWDNEVVPLAGDLFVRGLPAGSEVRLCIAWKAGEHFVPLAVAPELQMPHELVSPAPVAATEVAHRGPDAPEPTYFQQVQQAPLRPRFEPRRGRLRPIAVTFGAPSPDRGEPVRAALAGPGGAEPTYEERPDTGEPAPLRRPGRVTRTTRRRLGGASDLYTEEELRQQEELGELAGPGKPRGGASDLYGGASDLSQRGG
ncbi:MAG: DUF4912 domain-containing protein [Polyangiaceae bacterium]|nr:DUF4912 domain-containing protein [Polyangiaceae bacterium]